MKFEQFSETTNVGKETEETTTGHALEREVKRRALALELENANVEEMEQGEDRDKAIEQVDILNETLAELESVTGLSNEEIMTEYENLTTEAAKKGIEQLIAELDVSEEEKQELLLEAEKGISKFFEVIKTMQPKKLAFAAACFLIMSVSTATFAESAQEATNIHQPSYQVSIEKQEGLEQVPSHYEAQQHADQRFVAEETKEIMRKADERAKIIIENVEGFVKALAQKKVVDTIADHKDEIIASMYDFNRENPNLGNDAAQKLFEVYKGTIQEIDKLNNGEASEKIRGDLKEKIELIGTKDYTRIKKELLG